MIEIKKKADFKAAKEILKREKDEVIIKRGIKKIDKDAFWYCEGLTAITIPDSVTEICFGAFTHCTGLTSVTIPNSVTRIWQGAFQYCTNLKSVVIPESVKKIDEDAFLRCESLTELVLPNTDIKVDEYAFSGCKNLKHVTVPACLTWIFKDHDHSPDMVITVYEDTPQEAVNDDNDSEYVYTDSDRRNIALAFDYKMRHEYMMILNEYGDKYGELSGNEWYDYIDATYYDMDYQFIGKNQAVNMAYWTDNYFLIPARPEDVTKKVVKSVSKEGINEFYAYCNDSKITVRDLVYYLVRQFSLIDEVPFDEEDIESIKELIDEDLNPLGISFQQKMIKKVFIPAYRLLCEVE